MNTHIKLDFGLGKCTNARQYLLTAKQSGENGASYRRAQAVGSTKKTTLEHLIYNIKLSFKYHNG